MKAPKSLHLLQELKPLISLSHHHILYSHFNLELLFPVISYFHVFPIAILGCRTASQRAFFVLKSCCYFLAAPYFNLFLYQFLISFCISLIIYKVENHTSLQYVFQSVRSKEHTGNTFFSINYHRDMFTFCSVLGTQMTFK